MKAEDLKVRFVKNLKLSAKAMCLYWIDEIHIDESLKDSVALNDIIKHEREHYRLVQKIVSTNSQVLKWLWTRYNNIWDILSCMKITAKYFKGNFLEFYIVPALCFVFAIILMELTK